MSYSIKHLFHINAPREDVFNAITSIEGLSNWWTTQSVGEASLGGSIQFDFGEFAGPKMEVTQAKNAESVSWKCVASEHGWLGHIFTFFLDENEGKTRVRFTHDGWEDNGDFYAACNFSWGRYLESLRQYCQTGVGEAYGSENYRQ